MDCNEIRREEPALIVRSGKFARLTRPNGIAGRAMSFGQGVRREARGRLEVGNRPANPPVPNGTFGRESTSGKQLAVGKKERNKNYD